MQLIKKTKNSKIINIFLTLLISLLSIEVLFRLISEIKVFDLTLIRIVIGIIVLSLFLSLVLSFISKKVAYILSLFIILVFSIYGIAQLGFDSFIGVYMSVNTSSQLGAVKDYVVDFIASFEWTYYLLIIPFFCALVYLIINFKLTNNDSNIYYLKSHIRKQNIIKILCSSIIIISFSIVYLDTLDNQNMQNEMQMVSNKDLFLNPSVPSIAVKNFGVIGFGINDFKAMILKTPVTEGTIYQNNFEEPKETERTFDDTNWNNIISNESNQTLNSINNYLINNKITDSNEYTGMLKNKNIIVIMMESAGEILINNEYYPNFYKMYSEGYSFVNNYSPRNSCSTGNNEFSAMTGLYSIYNNCTANVYKNNTYPESIFGLFNEAGYKTISMHDYTEAYYYRSVIHTNMGVSKYYGVQALGIDYQNEYINWASDEDFASSAMDIVLNNEEYQNNPFMLWMTTVSSHQPYSVDSITGNMYYDLFADLPYSTDVKRYMSKLKILDNALGILMERLQVSGKLDDTVFVLFGDHYPYGISLNNLREVLNYDLADYENERTPFAIYGTGLESKVFEQYTSYINITPTIANLFGLNYDPRLYMGSDILDESYESKTVFADGSWKNDNIYFNAQTGNIINYQDNDYTNEKIISINQDITTKINMSSLIIKNNYFDYLFTNLAKENSKNNEVIANKEEE